MQAKFLILLSFVLIGLTSCSLMDRRDFEHVMNERHDDQMWSPNQDFPVVAGDNGRYYRDQSEINYRVPQTEKEQKSAHYDRSLNEELRYKEMALSDLEYEQYLKIKSQLGEASEKIYFLNLSPREKRSYLRARNIEIKHYYSAQEMRARARNNQYTESENSYFGY